jgi:hypothetical protein
MVGVCLYTARGCMLLRCFCCTSRAAAEVHRADGNRNAPFGAPQCVALRGRPLRSAARRTVNGLRSGAASDPVLLISDSQISIAWL